MGLGVCWGNHWGGLAGWSRLGPLCMSSAGCFVDGLGDWLRVGEEVMLCAHISGPELPGDIPLTTFICPCFEEEAVILKRRPQS